jgi:hypothetical protein
MLKVMELLDPPLQLAIKPNVLPTLIQKLSSDIEEYKRFEDMWQNSTVKAVLRVSPTARLTAHASLGCVTKTSKRFGNTSFFLITTCLS